LQPARPIEEFVAKDDVQIAIRTLDIERGPPCVTVPPEARTCPVFSGRRDGLGILRGKLEGDVHRLAASNQRCPIAKHRIPVLDSHDAALERRGKRAERAHLSVERPIAGEIGL
jgi:hypothetical protein